MKKLIKTAIKMLGVLSVAFCCYSCSSANSIEKNTDSDVINAPVAFIADEENTTTTDVTVTTEAQTTTTETVITEYVASEPKTEAVTTQTETVVTEPIVTDVTNQSQQENSHIIWKDGYQYYRVEGGETWTSIADILGTTPIQLAAANNATTEDVLYVGIDLFVPNANIDYTANTSYPQTSNNKNTSGESGTCLSSVTLNSAPDSASWNNIEVSMSYLNGVTLAPGESFDWNNYIGWMTISSEYGYQEAPVFVGTEVAYAAGGGVCVTSTALYQAARDAGMNIIERHDHSKNVSYANPGDEASVSYGEINLVFENTTGQNVVFYTSCSYGSVTVSCYIA